MSSITNFLKRKSIWAALNCMALAVVAMNAQQCCYWFGHQPEFPAEADKYRKYM